MAEISQTRFDGARWIVAMCDKEWTVFCGVSPKAYQRLAAILEQFCEQGEANLPPAWLRWVTPDPEDAPGAEVGAFEACGVVLYGRKAPNGARGTFFITQVVVDVQPADPPKRARRNLDQRQGFLPLDSNHKSKRRRS